MDNLPALPDPNPESSIEMLISRAISNNVPVETLERLLAMRKELKVEYAAEQFAMAMSRFQADCPIIKKTKSVTTKSGSVAYRYAPIESIVVQIRHLLKEHGFSYSIQTITNEKTVTATCTVKHILGHAEYSNFTVPLGSQTAVMSDTQVVAAALTFAKRYAFCNAFGILTGDTDDDAKKRDVEMVSEEQLAEITTLLKQVTYTEEQLLKNYGVKTAKELTEKAASSFILNLKAYITRLNSGKE